MAYHDCAFIEEREPSGRIIVGPCIVCGKSASAALATLRTEFEKLSRHHALVEKVVVKLGANAEKEAYPWLTLTAKPQADGSE